MRRKKFVVMKVEEEAKRRLDIAKEFIKRPYSDIILKYLPPFEDIWKEELYRLFKELKERFPKKEPILEFMRLIILYSEQLPEDLMRECDEEVRRRLNELSHYVFEQKKKEKEKTQVFYQKVEHNSHEIKNAVEVSIPKVSKENVDTFLKNHSDAFFTAKEVVNGLNIEGKESILKVSKILYRLWKNTDVERRKRGKLWEYRYKKALNEKYPAENEILSKKTMKRDYSKRDNGKHGKKNNGEDSISKISTGNLDISKINNDFEAYEHIELLDEPFYGFCYECGIEKQVDFYAQRGDEEVYLCYKHGIQVKEWLEETFS